MMSNRPKDELGQVVSVNVGKPREVEWAGRVVTTSIWKTPVHGRVEVRGVNIDGDDQADRRVHGGLDKAVYAYASEDYRWWSETLRRDIEPGTFGENITTAGIDISSAVVGQHWSIGGLVLEISEPRLPCAKLGIRMDDPGFVDHFKEAERFGTYLRIVEEGSVAAGDEIAVGPPPSHGLTVTAIGSAYPEASDELIERMLEVEALADGWRLWAERARARALSMPKSSP